MKHTKRTTVFKLTAYCLYCTGMTAEAALKAACSIHGTEPSGCMEAKYASSYMSEDIRGWLHGRIRKGDQMVIEYFCDHELPMPDPV